MKTKMLKKLTFKPILPQKNHYFGTGFAETKSSTGNRFTKGDRLPLIVL